MHHHGENLNGIKGSPPHKNDILPRKEPKPGAKAVRWSDSINRPLEQVREFEVIPNERGLSHRVSPYQLIPIFSSLIACHSLRSTKPVKIKINDVGGRCLSNFPPSVLGYSPSCSRLLTNHSILSITWHSICVGENHVSWRTTLDACSTWIFCVKISVEGPKMRKMARDSRK